MNGVPVKGKNKIKTIVLMMAMGVAMAAMADDFQTNPVPAHMCGNVAEEARFPAPLVLPKGTGFGFEPHGTAFSLLCATPPGAVLVAGGPHGTFPFRM